MRLEKYSFIILILLLACDKETVQKNHLKQINFNLQPIGNEEQVSDFIFGFYAGNCSGNCSPMFKLIKKYGQIYIYADFEDNFFKSYFSDSLRFNTELVDRQQIILANDILKNLPKGLLELKETNKRFGCPDCNDGGGVYIEFKKDGITKTYYIEPDFESSNELEKEVLLYAHYVTHVISYNLVPISDRP